VHSTQHRAYSIRGVRPRNLTQMPRKSKHAGGNAAAAEAPVRRSLLDDDDDDGAAEPVLTVNQEFARRFQARRRCEAHLVLA
jgi:hypothetical protein